MNIPSHLSIDKPVHIYLYIIHIQLVKINIKIYVFRFVVQTCDVIKLKINNKLILKIKQYTYGLKINLRISKEVMAVK